MLEKPIEWRRFERVELEGDVAKTAPRSASIASVSSAPSLLHEFERVLRENERLQLEVSTLRAEIARSNGRTPKFREELESARAELARLEDEAVTPHAARPDARDNSTPSHAEDAKTAIDTTTWPDIADIVAGYIFADPTAANVRLVQDALRGRAIGKAANDPI